MRPALPSCKLFHGPMWVAALALLVGCDGGRPPVDIAGETLPAHHREVNWMEVLDNLPRDKNRAKQRDHLFEADSAFWVEWCEAMLQLGPASDTLTVDNLNLFLAEMA
ncbi:MAG: hypothetical protein P8H88_06035, partial [Flavobacteriales bacterium]|nr:hypothetical protein [Flavobacteriales bacterium]